MLLHGILRNVLDMQIVVRRISNAMITETSLPHRELKMERLTNSPGRTPFNELHGPFESRSGARCQ